MNKEKYQVQVGMQLWLEKTGIQIFIIITLHICGDDPEQNAETIHASNPEHLFVFKALCGDDLEQNAGKIHKSNPEHLLVFKASFGDNPKIQSWTPPCF